MLWAAVLIRRHSRDSRTRPFWRSEFKGRFLWFLRLETLCFSRSLRSDSHSNATTHNRKNISARPCCRRHLCSHRYVAYVRYVRFAELFHTDTEQTTIFSYPASSFKRTTKRCTRAWAVTLEPPSLIQHCKRFRQSIYLFIYLFSSHTCPQNWKWDNDGSKQTNKQIMR